MEALKKVLRGALIAAAGAILTYITQALPDVNIPDNMLPIVVAGWSVFVNIARKMLETWASRAVMIFLVCLLPVDSKAGNLAASFSHGPTLPFFTVSFDSVGVHDGVHGGWLNQGAGYSFNWNFAPTETGAVRMLTVGVPVFANFNGGDPSTFSFAVGATLGTFNNLVSIGPAVRVINVAPGREPDGVFANGFTREDVFMLVSFGLNLGGGTPAPRSKLSLRAAAPESPPPCYLKLR